MDGVEKRAAGRRPAQGPSSGVSYVPKNVEEYIKQQEIEYEYSSKQAYREMLMSIVSPLGNYLSQRFVLGLQSWIEPQQPMLTQPKNSTNQLVLSYLLTSVIFLSRFIGV